MNLLISAFGKIANGDPHHQLIEEYRKRLPWKLQINELQDKKLNNSEERKQQESKALLQSVPKGYFLIALDETGQNYTSRQFADYIEQLQSSGTSNIAFAIGGAYGHDNLLLKQSGNVISLGKGTLPHKLARVILVEQIYRAYTIISGHPYHK